MSYPPWLISDLLRTFGVKTGESLDAKQLMGGLQHEVWKVQLASGSIVIKRQTKPPSALAIALEQAAERGDVACAGSLTTAHGQRVVQQQEDGDQYFIRAYHYIEGDMCSREPVTAELAHAVGEQLALLHTSSQRLLGEELQKIHTTEITDYYDITALPQSVRDQVRPFTTDFDISQKQAIIGHRDVSGKNIIIEAASQKPYLIDFDEAGLTTVDGEVVDAAFNLAGVHTAAGPQKVIVRACIEGYRKKRPDIIKFDMQSFHMLIGMSEYWWLGCCLNRVKDGRISEDGLEETEIRRLMEQLPRDLALLPTWLDWLV